MSDEGNRSQAHKLLSKTITLLLDSNFIRAFIRSIHPTQQSRRMTNLFPKLEFQSSISTLVTITHSLAGTSFSTAGDAKENSGACNFRNNLTHMSGALATVDMNTLEEQPRRMHQNDKSFFTNLQEENYDSSSLLLDDEKFERTPEDSYVSDDDSLGSSFSAVSSLSADESQLFDQCNLSAIHPDEHEQDNEQDSSRVASPFPPPRECRPPRPQQSVSRKHKTGFPPRGPLPTIASSRTFRALETPPRVIQRSSSQGDVNAPSIPLVFRTPVRDSNSVNSIDNYSRARSEYIIRQSHSIGTTRTPISANQSFESAHTADSSFISEAVSSIINRGPRPNNQNLHHRRVKSECTFNTPRTINTNNRPAISTTDSNNDAIIINGKVVECKHRNAPTSPQASKDLLGSRPRRPNYPNSAPHPHRRNQSNGSWDVKSMMTAESTCLSSAFSAAVDDEQSAGCVGSTSYYQAEKPKNKTKNVVAEEIKYKMGKMIPSLSPVRPLGRRLSSLMKGKVDSDDKVVLDRANNGFLA